MKDIELIALSGNIAVAKVVGRQFPGVLIQGDTLYILSNLIKHAKEAQEIADFDEAKDILDEAYNKLTNYLQYYEAILEKNNMSLPYFR